jgi:hypothetical protein
MWVLPAAGVKYLPRSPAKNLIEHFIILDRIGWLFGLPACQVPLEFFDFPATNRLQLSVAHVQTPKPH